MPLYIFKMISLWLVTSVGVGRGRRDEYVSTCDATVKIQMTSTKLNVGPFSVSAHTVHSARVHTHTHTHTPHTQKHTQSHTQTHTHTHTHTHRDQTLTNTHSLTDRHTHTHTHAQTERESEGPIDTQTET